MNKNSRYQNQPPAESGLASKFVSLTLDAANNVNLLQIPLSLKEAEDSKSKGSGSIVNYITPKSKMCVALCCSDHQRADGC